MEKHSHDPKETRENVNEHWVPQDGFKIPKAVVFGPIPKTSAGKIQKFLLRNPVHSAKAISA